MSESSSNIVFAGNEPSDDLSVLDLLDHVLNAGVVVRGNLVISLAGVDLIYVGLDVLLTSIETDAFTVLSEWDGESISNAIVPTIQHLSIHIIPTIS